MTNNWKALHISGGMDISNYQTRSISLVMSGNFVRSYSIKKWKGFFSVMPDSDLYTTELL